MILRLALFALALGSSLTAPLFAGGERGNGLLAELGGTPGIAGAAGTPGVPGLPGIPGIPGGSATVLAGADFYALMPTDNPAPILGGAAVAFPNAGFSFGAPPITMVGPGTTFALPATGTYVVLFQASVTEAGQLMLSLNGVPLANTVVGRATLSSQIVETAFISASAGDLLSVINPAGQTSLTITPLAGGTHAVTAHLVILRIR